MMNIDKSALKAQAEAVVGLNKESGHPWEKTIVDGRLGRTSTAYALAANPATILALLAEIDDLKSGLVTSEERNIWLGDYNTQRHVELSAENVRVISSRLEAEKERDQLKAENKSLKTQLAHAIEFQPIGEACLSNRDELRAKLGLKRGDNLHEHVEALSKDLESHKRMLLAAVCDLGAVGEALGADMDDDGSELEGLAQELRKDAERYRWLRDGDYLHCWVSLHPCDESKSSELTDKAIDDAMSIKSGIIKK